MRRRLSTIAVLSLLLGVVACQSTPPPHFYLISEPRLAPSPARSSADGVHLVVSSFSVDSPYDGDQLVYRVGADSPEIAYYAHHRWAAPLREQLPTVALSAFGDLPGLASIFPMGAGRNYDVELLGRLLYLEELDLPGEQSARVGLELALVDREGERLWSQTVSAKIGGQAEEVTDIVGYMRRALEDVFQQARPGLSEALAKLTE